MARGLFLIWMIPFVHLISLSSQQDIGFVYTGFDPTDLYLDGVATVLSSRLLQLTNASSQKIGHAFYKQPIEFNSAEPFSFSTHFVCALVPIPGLEGGHGMAFVASSSIDFTHAEPTQYLGLFNISTNISPSSHVFAVELDTVLSAEFDDIDNNHVGIDLNSPQSIVSAPASYFSNTKRMNQMLHLLSGDRIQVWVDYDGTVLNVSLAPLIVQKPSQPLLSRAINLSEVFPDKRVFVGFSAATGTLTSYQYVLGWSFSRGSVLLQDMDMSKLPHVHRHKPGHKTSPQLIVLVILLTLIVLAAIGGAYVYRRNKYAEVRDPWEKEYGPHRFSYKSLYKATEGFDKDRLLGKGGFGEIYRGNLSLGSQIAVKRVSHEQNAEQGMKQFVAEVVSMGNLKHRNLVPLLGYCRRKGELLLVSEYMPNGSLDQYLFHDQKPALSWSQRLAILRDVASALNYLHTGADKVFIHRDIKASNVMLDGEFSGRLGDFGMARFHEHGATPATTSAVGTLGYMAPELTVRGASTETDVYAFGAFALEVTCGRRPVEIEIPAGDPYLVKWVYESWERDSLIEVKDPRLGGEFSCEEVEMVLKLGLLCTNMLPESRPTMEQVVQYLNWSLPLPEISPGIGAFTPVGLEAFSSFLVSSTSRRLPDPLNSSCCRNNSVFVTHTIIYGEGR